MSQPARPSLLPATALSDSRARTGIGIQREPSRARSVRRSTRLEVCSGDSLSLAMAPRGGWLVRWRLERGLGRFLLLLRG